MQWPFIWRGNFSGSVNPASCIISNYWALLLLRTCQISFWTTQGLLFYFCKSNKSFIWRIFHLVNNFDDWTLLFNCKIAWLYGTDKFNISSGDTYVPLAQMEKSSNQKPCNVTLGFNQVLIPCIFLLYCNSSSNLQENLFLNSIDQKVSMWSTLCSHAILNVSCLNLTWGASKPSPPHSSAWNRIGLAILCRPC